jgi:hypothetical protein
MFAPIAILSPIQEIAAARINRDSRKRPRGSWRFAVSLGSALSSF